MDEMEKDSQRSTHKLLGQWLQSTSLVIVSQMSACVYTHQIFFFKV
jgi:hypothetical protein